VGQVDYMTTPEELLGHFEACGTVERVTIVCDKYTGKPKGTYIILNYTYI
jgi:polyadenylate-binding protein 2